MARNPKLKSASVKENSILAAESLRPVVVREFYDEPGGALSKVTVSFGRRDPTGTAAIIADFVDGAAREIGFDIPLNEPGESARDFLDAFDRDPNSFTPGELSPGRTSTGSADDTPKSPLPNEPGLKPALDILPLTIAVVKYLGGAASIGILAVEAGVTLVEHLAHEALDKKDKPGSGRHGAPIGDPKKTPDPEATESGGFMLPATQLRIRIALENVVDPAIDYLDPKPSGAAAKNVKERIFDPVLTPDPDKGGGRIRLAERFKPTDPKRDDDPSHDPFVKPKTLKRPGTVGPPR